MKQFQIILGLILFASVTTFAQSPRIKLNQITKDTVKGSVLISNPTDSGMVYSRDFYIAYGLTDTVLILYGDTLASTSGIISSVLSDGVTITGNGTLGSELKVDTALIATIKALNDSLATVSTSTTPDGVTITGDGSVGNPLKVDTLLISTIQGLVDTLTARGYLTANQTITLLGDVTGSGTTAITATVVDDSHNHVISNVDFLQDSLTAKANASELSNYVTIAGTETITGAKTFTANTVFDDSTLVVQADSNRVGIMTSTPNYPLEVDGEIGTKSYGQFIRSTQSDGISRSLFGFANYGLGEALTFGSGGTPSPLHFYVGSSGPQMIVTNGSTSEVLIGYTSDNGPYKLQVNGQIFATSSTIATSDIKYKDNIQSINESLPLLMQLNPVSYNFKQDPVHNFPTETQIGLIAQEVESVFSGSNYLNSIVYDNNGYKGLAYDKLIPITVKAIQEQQAIIETQQTEIDQLKTLITDLTNRLIILENK